VPEAARGVCVSLGTWGTNLVGDDFVEHQEVQGNALEMVRHLEVRTPRRWSGGGRTRRRGCGPWFPEGRGRRWASLGPGAPDSSGTTSSHTRRCWRMRRRWSDTWTAESLG